MARAGDPDARIDHEAFEAARDLAIECLAREAERQWLHNETVSIRVEADPDGS
jgi:hypothetical protein